MNPYQGMLRLIIQRMLAQRAAAQAAAVAAQRPQLPPDQYTSDPEAGRQGSVYSYLREMDRIKGQPRTTGADPNTTTIVHGLPKGRVHSA